MPLPALREKPGKGHFQDPVFIGYRDALRHAGGLEILALLDGGAGIYQMPQPAGDPFRPKRSIRRENFVIVGIALDVVSIAYSALLKRDISSRMLPILREISFRSKNHVPPAFLKYWVCPSWDTVQKPDMSGQSILAICVGESTTMMRRLPPLLPRRA